MLSNSTKSFVEFSKQLVELLKNPLLTAAKRIAKEFGIRRTLLFLPLFIIEYPYCRLNVLFL